jgi:hypothetical protein
VKYILLKIFLLLAVLGTLGCAAKSGVPQTMQIQTFPDIPGAIKLECKVANQLGCRHQGRIFPWNAWVEAMGYNSTQYAVHDVIRAGNKATVLIMKR